MASASRTFTAASGTTGFFQENPVVRSAFEEDEALKRVFRFYLPSRTQNAISSDLNNISNLVLSRKVLNWCADAERNVPYIRSYDSWGRRIDDLVTSAGWQNLQAMGQAEGMVACGHERTHAQYSRVHQFLKVHIWTPSCAYTTCPGAMTDGAARLLFLQLTKGNSELGETEKEIFRNAYDRLVSRDVEKAWTSGQWMTERPGGSDVQNTETHATLAPANTPITLDAHGDQLGPYSISGFKWFSSATDANLTVLLARESTGVISAFFAPTRRILPNTTESEFNGISIQRLKNKLGTRALPTAELVLKDMRAWRIGKSGQGTREISTILNITRVHTAVGAVSQWGRGLSIARAFARVRKARGKLLMNTPAHVRTMAEQHVQYRAMIHLTFYAVALLGLSEQGAGSAGQDSPCEASCLAPREAVQSLLRLVTPLAKMMTAKAAIAGLAECMESLGGVGYLENEDVALNVARLFRDVNVLSIWEGTTNIMADDLVRIVKGSAGKAVLDALGGVVSTVLEKWSKQAKAQLWADAVRPNWSRLRTSIEQSGREDLAIAGRELGRDLGWLICAILLGEDALHDGAEIADEIASRWILHDSYESGRSWKDKAIWDRRIVFGMDSVGPVARL
ncbi:unnamed protein product [Zymoseptoria tritici ST99CH_1A5]|uniref:Acyl-CoA dehydrogenase n=3 Tax=Zymoseptoria tritici TaxID=1047171 RepID=F9XG11_ZYMTI|nr:uncharacterized protein MYCGRDRAFT_74103 [Zymoseptoria tritici IPO323]EGP86083.1 hypothetical protein MYCGRDRAFT_74103 [Zymoseptoria tritici IPO323]SMR55393.1 unnamed protein product [Zymoseptoria tritici ST99CH_1E4]SMR57770.1 unnamed protein product [Zymoseptoria tritici ST99CH_3D1]SMY26204.1 unnamed protein product [Zymoseptoria tritici ST99CH_1A5]